MLRSLWTICFVIAGLVAASVPLFAHHGGAAYDTDKPVIVEGTVMDYVWSNRTFRASSTLISVQGNTY